jgi:hypothetical protein
MNVSVRFTTNYLPLSIYLSLYYSVTLQVHHPSIRSHQAQVKYHVLGSFE